MKETQDIVLSSLIWIYLFNTFPVILDFNLIFDCSFCSGCAHQLCVKCALYLCSTSNITSEMVAPQGSIPCPLCRNGIVSFIKLPTTPAKELKPNLTLSLCNPCILHPRALAPPATASCRSEFRRNCVAAVSSEVICPLSCTPFPSAAILSCSCDDDPCSAVEFQGEGREQSPRGSQSSAPNELEDKLDEQRLERTSCSGIFWSRRSCHREHQCNSEINA